MSELRRLAPLRDADLTLLKQYSFVFPRVEGITAQQGRRMLLGKFVMFCPFFLLFLPFNSMSSGDLSHRVRQIAILSASKSSSFPGFCSL